MIGLVLALALDPATSLTTAESVLHETRPGAAVRELRTRLAQSPREDTVRFALGVAQFALGLETLGQSLYRHGLDSRPGQDFGLPILRFPVPRNPDPEPIDYDRFRLILSAWRDSLQVTSATLLGIHDEGVKLALRFERLRLDLDGDGVAADSESLLALYSRYNARVRSAAGLGVRLDAADAHWLRGYCELLTALADFVLAYDQREQFERTASLFFASAREPAAALSGTGSETTIVDGIAWIHLFHWKLRDPARMAAALEHLRVMVTESRATWDSILGETDDDHEWIPSPRQTPLSPAGAVNAEMVAEWRSFLDDLDALLRGRKLLGHWRVAGGSGVNLSRVFTQPREFDPVLWIQGSAALPYLETGEVVDRRSWDRLQRVFRGEFMGFFIWFN